MERKWKVLALAAFGSFTSFLDAPVVTVAFPAISETFPQASATTLVWVLDGYLVAFAACAVFAGRIADRYGGRRAFIGGVAAFTAASVVAAAATSVEVLLAARVAQGIAAAFIVPAGQALMLREFPLEQRRMALGVLAAIAGLAIAVSPTIGGVVVDWLGWRWVFYINLATGAATLLYAVRLVSATPVEGRRGSFPDVLGALLQAAVGCAVLLVILRYDAWGAGDWRTLAAVATAAVALPLLLRRSRAHPSPVLDLTLFRERTFAVANLGSLLFAITFYGTVMTWVLFMTGVWHYSVLTTGLTFIPGAVVGALVGGAAGRVAEERGARSVAVAGSLAAVVGLMLIIVSTGERPAFFTDALPGGAIYSVGATAAITALLGAAMTSVPPSQYALASGINLALRQVGGALGVAAVAAIAANAAGDMLTATHVMFAIGAGGALAAGLVSLLIPPRAETGADLRATLEPEALVPATSDIRASVAPATKPETPI